MTARDYSKVPAELKALPQWVCARANNKIPINPKTGRNASVTDPTSWGTYEEAVKAGFPHLGFVFTENDPYAGIDLDPPINDIEKARHSKIFESFVSYTEYSQSGNGLHIIVKGEIPHAVKRDHVEVYDRGRYFIMTGKQFNGRPGTIEDCSETLLTLVEEMGGASRIVLSHSEPQRDPDDVILRRCHDSANGAKFLALWGGQWSGTYGSQSEADYALINHLAFASHNNEQTKRLFRTSALGQRDKALREDYLDSMIGQIRAEQNPPVDFSNFTPPPIKAVSNPNQPSILKYDIRRYDGVEPPPPDWQVKGLIEHGTLIEIVGQWGSGKTFVALDLLACIASGTDYHGRPVAQGPVVYFCGEGQRGLNGRLSAWTLESRVRLSDQPIFLCTTPAALSEEGDAQAVIDAILATGETPVHVCFDTRSRNFGVGDENSPKDMGMFLAACDKIIHEFGCTVSAIHHPGHMDKSRGRGHSAWLGALDVSYRITKKELDPYDILVVEVAKSPKDFESPEPFAFQLKTVKLGKTDEDGVSVTSCVLQPTTKPTVPRKRPAGKVQRQALTILQKLESRLDSGHVDPGVPDLSITEHTVSFVEWRGACLEADIKESSFYDARRALERDGFIIPIGDRVRSSGSRALRIYEP